MKKATLVQMKKNVGGITGEQLEARIKKVRALMKSGVSKTRACYTSGIWVGQYNRATKSGPKPKKSKKAA